MTTANPTAAPPQQIAQAIQELKALLDTRASTAAAVREHHSHGESHHAPAAPDVVCFPRTTEEVSEIMRISARHGVPVIPFGAGSSVEGHVQAVRGGITVDTREMNKIVRVSPEDMDATVEAGVTRTQFTKALENTGLTFFVDPGADASLGGMTATRASGTTAVRYGTMRENVLGLTVVLADGRIIRTGTRARKSSAGYDLTRLFVGSEGTLGIITEITVRLHPYPNAVAAAVCAFDTVDAAVQTVIETIQLGVPVARVELLDAPGVDCVNRFSKLDYPVAPTLFFEFHGTSPQHLQEQSELVQSLAAEHGGHGFEWAIHLEDRDRLWEARHKFRLASAALRPNSTAYGTDVCVPISRLAEIIAATNEDLKSIGFPAPICGHVGDGNFHITFALDPTSPQEIAAVERISTRAVERALAMGGTCTGEHGVGLGKMGYLEMEHGPALDVMRAIKQALDPENRMNPGKMLEIAGR